MLPSKVMPAPTSKKRRATTTQRTRKAFDNVCILFCCIVVVALVFYCSGSSTHTTLVNAKEIEATHEWTLIGENDTIAAGMHVKMDMTTGEKWVKLMDEKDQKSQSETMSLGGGAGSSSSSTEGGDGGALVVQIDANGNVKTNNNNENENEEKIMDPMSRVATATRQSSTGKEEPKYNYEMMYRTLSKLPIEEQERIGGIPELPPDSDDESKTIVTPEQRLQFEQRMKEIWEQRQADLLAFQQDHLVDLPKLLKDRIQSLRDYLQQPKTKLQALDIRQYDNSNNPAGYNGDENDNDEDGFWVRDIVTVLQDLEYQLADIDMARDFYTLGGWPLLTSLLADATHEMGNATIDDTDSNNQKSLSEEDWNKVNLIQAHAAWVIGTMVKNTGEFIPYAVDVVQVLHDATGKAIVKTTPLDLVLAQFIASIKDVIDATSPKDHFYDTAVMKVHKTLYALGALLRANRQSQTHFCADQGPALLANVLSDLAEQAEANSNGDGVPTLSQDSLKVAQRLLSLAQDIVMDVNLHASKSEQVDDAIRNAFSSPEWCSVITKFVHMPRLYETTLQAIQQLAPCCGKHWDLLQVQQLAKEPPAHVRESWLPDDLDEEIRSDRMELLDSTIKAVQDAKQ